MSTSPNPTPGVVNGKGKQTEAVDFTKTRGYALTDLVTKTVSAIALVLLGFVGYLLQKHAEDAREQTETLQSQERRFLPMLRSLSILEMRLQDISDELNHPDSVDFNRAYQIGTRLRFVAASVFEPEADPEILLRGPIMPGTAPRLRMPLKSTALMYAEIFRMRAFLVGLAPNTELRLDPAADTIIADPNGTQGKVTIHLLHASIPAFQVWFASGTTRVQTFRVFPRQPNCQDLVFSIEGAIQNVLNAHPDLGDRYVQIREDIANGKDDEGTVVAPGMSAKGNKTAPLE